MYGIIPFLNCTQNITISFKQVQKGKCLSATAISSLLYTVVPNPGKPHMKCLSPKQMMSGNKPSE